MRSRLFMMMKNPLRVGAARKVMDKQNLTGFLFLVVMGLSGCGDKGSEFVGKWRHFPIDMRREPVLIERQGDGFTLRGPKFYDAVGRISGESLEVTWQRRGRISGGCNLIMNKTTGHLDGCGSELVRSAE